MSLSQKGNNNFTKNLKTCIYCGKTTTGGNIVKHYNERCKSK